MRPGRALAALAAAVAAFGQTPANVLVVANADSLSERTASYYARQRSIPASNVCRIDAPREEEIEWTEYDLRIERPVARCLRERGLRDSILYVALMPGVPLKIRGAGPKLGNTAASVDSELTLLYGKMLGRTYSRTGPLRNPFFGMMRARFTHAQFPMYLVTRLAGYGFSDIQGLVDRGLEARNRGRYVIDLRSAADDEGNRWLRRAAAQLPQDRVVLDETDAVLYERAEVIAYASWGSNDRHRSRRFLNHRWLPGAIATEFVSTNARTFARPPETFQLGVRFAGSGQSLTGDYVQEGATGASGHVYEPYLGFTPRPDILLPAYHQGRTLAESYYLAIPALSWMNVVVGDPLVRLR